MPFQPWMLGIMEEYGLTDTNTGHINRVANYLAKSPNDVIETSEFSRACIACNVDPDSFTQKDLDELQSILDRIT